MIFFNLNRLTKSELRPSGAVSGTPHARLWQANLTLESQFGQTNLTKLLNVFGIANTYKDNRLPATLKLSTPDLVLK
jgi:hypothetical protein